MQLTDSCGVFASQFLTHIPQIIAVTKWNWICHTKEYRVVMELNLFGSSPQVRRFGRASTVIHARMQSSPEKFICRKKINKWG